MDGRGSCRGVADTPRIAHGDQRAVHLLPNPETGDVRVRVLHNERDAELPVGGGPYYPWETLRDYCKSLYE